MCYYRSNGIIVQLCDSCRQAFEIAMRNLFIRLSLYRNTRLSVQAVRCPYLRQKPLIFQESWVPPTENCSSVSAADHRYRSDVSP